MNPKSEPRPLRASAKLALPLIAVGAGVLAWLVDMALFQEFGASPMRGNPLRDLLPAVPPVWPGCVLVGVCAAACAVRLARPRPKTSLLAGLLLCGLAGAGAAPQLVVPHKCRYRPWGALKTIGFAQSLFREGDKEQDSNFDYGTLRELSDTTLIDGVLGSGTKFGYLFEVVPSATTPEFLWYATVRRAAPLTAGDPYLCTNQAGIIYYTRSAPFQIDPNTCEIPAHAVPLGK